MVINFNKLDKIHEKLAHSFVLFILESQQLLLLCLALPGLKVVNFLLSFFFSFITFSSLLFFSLLTVLRLITFRFHHCLQCMVNNKSSSSSLALVAVLVNLYVHFLLSVAPYATLLHHLHTSLMYPPGGLSIDPSIPPEFLSNISNVYFVLLS